MGLTWEHFADAAATYNVTSMDPELYVNISKAIGVISCVLAYILLSSKIYSNTAENCIEKKKPREKKGGKID